MSTITRVFGLALISAALVTGVSVPVANAQSAIDWKPCPEDATAECGTLRLPIDYANPSGEKFDLAVARRRATDPAKRVGILLVNPGGPGASGVGFAISQKDYFTADVRSRFDIIGWDPRGVARSQPVKCSLDMWAKEPSKNPATQAEFDALVKFNREFSEDCRKRSGPIFDHADTGATIQDMDAIRRSLGEQKINYYGISYGTLMGQQYAERYGDKIRAMVIDSNMDHSQRTWSFAATEAQTAESSFNEWVKWCDRTVSCALHGKDVTKMWDDLLARADRGEVTDVLDPGDPSEPPVITARNIAALGLDAFYGPSFQEFAKYAAQLDAQKPPQRRSFGDAEINFARQATFCSDWSLPVRSFTEYKMLEATENALAPHMRGGALGHDSIARCIGFPEKVNNPQRQLSIKNAPKILMLNALYDPATPYSWAANAHRQSKDTTVLLTYEGWGHGVYRRSQCTDKAVDSYFATLETPAPGARCAAVEPGGAALRTSDARPQVIPGWGR
ncbi:pimeloyl-ACP methyl ester carboxylesterase [Kibdelosporangium banguiense]|uniref:Pimeloyl-ACP methyl ester carboxylesterase n=1 Tax=Kibdelosporangium banguiense TaxID=1365924 RepID=A0ABS4TE47_9PSEU|nr:alpha/beta hydrolase [Kibdelosporangium banguiense]MBP2322121.1 pimeloyl-ACP methyl ester carboxylesterase [Kibdelosporangium banguiense]